MKPKYNISDEVFLINNNGIDTILSLKPRKILKINNTGGFGFVYEISDRKGCDILERALISKQEYITYLLEKSAELISLANKLQDQIDGEGAEKVLKEGKFLSVEESNKILDNLDKDVN